MLSYQDVLSIANSNREPGQLFLKYWRDVYFGMSLHTTGAAPFYKTLGTAGTGALLANQWIYQYPPNYFGLEYHNIFAFQLLNSHPRENENTRWWRYSQYKPFQKGAFDRAIELMTGAIFQDSNYSLTLKKKEDNDYIWGNHFRGHNLIGYFSHSARTIIEDPNGFFVTMPREPYYNTTTTQVEPDIWFVHSYCILYISDDEFVFKQYKRDYQNFMYYADTEYTVWHVTKDSIYRYIKEDGTNEYVMHPEDVPYGGYYGHYLGYLPIDIAGGVWNNKGFYDSWLCKAKAIADQYVTDKSNEQLVNKEASHPWIVAVNSECPDCREDRGYNWIDCADCPDGRERIACRTCNGSCEISRNPGDWLSVPQELMGKGKMIDITNPDMGINKQWFETNNKLYEQLEYVLYIKRVEQVQSGIAKALDREDQQIFLAKVTNDWFDRLIPNQTKNIIGYRNVRRVGETNRPDIYQFEIGKPTQFLIQSSYELLEETEKANSAKAPKFIKIQLARQLADKMFGGDDMMNKKADVIADLDPLMTVTDAAALASLKNNGVYDARDIRFSEEVPIILDGLIRDKGENWFKDASFDDIKTAVDAEFSKVILPFIEVKTENIERDNLS